MPSKARLRQTSHATNSANETPSERHRDFVPRRKGPQKPFHESVRVPDWIESPAPRLPPRACSLADLQPQSSANKEQSPRTYESKNFTKKTASTLQPWLFQKQIHAVEIYDGLIVVEGVDPEDTAYSRPALLYREIRQCRNAKFRRRNFEVADLKILNFSGTDFSRGSAGKMRRNPRGFHRDAERSKKSFVESRNKCAGINEQTSRLPMD